MSTVIDTSSPALAWRYGCPKGHRSIEPSNGGIWCRACSRNPSIEDPHYHDILDKRTGETIPWDDVEIV